LKREAFSLIELMIVIVIMGVVYTLSVNNFKKISEESSSVNLGNLKEYLISLKAKKNAKILCLDDCSSCDILVDGEKKAVLEDFLDESVLVYRYEYLTGVQERMKEVYFNEDDVQEDVCFSYSVDSKGVGEQVLVEFKTKVYDFTNYFDATKKYESMQEATQNKAKLIEEARR